MDCPGTNGPYAEYVVAWKCNDKEYDCSLAVLYEVKVKKDLDTSIQEVKSEEMEL
jgi:hypothetical protein